jgi:hypothetical protein
MSQNAHVNRPIRERVARLNPGSLDFHIDAPMIEKSAPI